jgi:hypothetical protein
MGKVLHASGSGYFPYCLRNYPAEGVIIGPYQPLPMSLNAAMRVFWRIKRFRFYGTYTLDPFGRQEVRNWEMIFERNAESEENLVCNPDYNYVGGENIEEGGAFVLEPFTVQGSQYIPDGFFGGDFVEGAQEQGISFATFGDNDPQIAYNFEGIVFYMTGFENTYYEFRTLNHEILEYWSYGGTYDTSTGLPL